jgi:hypothetical protein
LPVLDVAGLWSGGINEGVLAGFQNVYNSGRLGYITNVGMGNHVVATSASSMAGDPANITSLNFYSGAQAQLFFAVSTA